MKINFFNYLLFQLFFYLLFYYFIICFDVFFFFCFLIFFKKRHEVALDWLKRKNDQKILETIEGNFGIAQPFLLERTENRDLLFLFERKEKMVCWKAYGDTIFALVLNPILDNLTLCTNFLHFFPNTIETQHFKRPGILQNWKEVC